MIVPASATASRAASMDLRATAGSSHTLHHRAAPALPSRVRTPNKLLHNDVTRPRLTSMRPTQSRLGRWWLTSFDWLTSQTQPRWALWMRYTARKQHHEAPHRSSQIVHRALAFKQNMEQMHHVLGKLDCGRQAPCSALTSLDHRSILFMKPRVEPLSVLERRPCG